MVAAASSTAPVPTPAAPEAPGQAEVAAEVDEIAAAAGTQRSIFEDRRDERNCTGIVCWEVEHGVPDVGGLGWRTRAGHLLKNQTYYAAQPNMNLWDCPAHAGPKTWTTWHGPRLRRDAALMERLDRRDAELQERETKEKFVNTVRLQTLNRLQHKKVENQQRELASQWAPHRRARREVHKSFDMFTQELDSMPMKELKKVLPSAVLKSDREAIRAITQRIQQEETRKAAWKQMEQERHQNTRSDFEQRRAFNDMLTELAGQPPRPMDPNHKLPNDCSERLEEMARPAEPKQSKHVTERPEYSGLYHVDNRFALEARFPGQGHRLSVTIAERATANAQPGWPPPRFETPHMGDDGGTIPPETLGTAAASWCVRRDSLPVSPQRLGNVSARNSIETQAQFATPQRRAAEAPPAPEQRKSLLIEPILNDALHMGMDSTPREQHTSRSGDAQWSARSRVDVAPPRRDFVYPVVVPAVEEKMARPDWRPRRPVCSVGARPAASAAPRRRKEAGTPSSASAAPFASARLCMPRVEPTVGAVCQALDEFDTALRPVPQLGNFWMTPRSEISSAAKA
mmetsp:Transcript_99914/g.317242  ORF Transcript_99914/g.317242 Transcript_99914/m.317242 type:complete len:570 (-) Transcript_99914:69-1778(-)